MFVLAQQTGDANGRTNQRVTVDDGTTRSSSNVTRTDKSNSNHNFTGTVDDEAGRSSTSGSPESNSGGEANVEVSYRENSNAGGFKSFVTSTGNSSGNSDFSSSGTLTSDHEKARQEGESEAKESGKEDFTIRTGYSNLTFGNGGFTWETVITTYEPGGNSSSDISDDYQFEQDYTDDEEDNSEEDSSSSSGDDSPDDNSGDGGDGGDDDPPEGNFKTISRDKVTTEIWRFGTFDTTDQDGRFNFYRKDESTVKNSLSEESARNSIRNVWEEDSFRKENKKPSGDVITVTIDEDGKRTRIFTTAGSEPGDKQSLKIGSKLDHNTEVHTDYATPKQSLDQYGGFATFTTVAEEETTTNVIKELTTYKASHTLGKDGTSAVGGHLTADHERSQIFTTIKSGEVVDGDTTYITNKYELSNENSIEQHEKTPYKGNNQITGGSATTTQKEIYKWDVDAEDFEDSIGAITSQNHNRTIDVKTSDTAVTTTTDTFGENGSQDVSSKRDVSNSVHLYWYTHTIQHDNDDAWFESHHNIDSTETVKQRPQQSNSSHSGQTHYWGEESNHPDAIGDFPPENHHQWDNTIAGDSGVAPSSQTNSSVGATVASGTIVVDVASPQVSYPKADQVGEATALSKAYWYTRGVKNGIEQQIVDEVYGTGALLGALWNDFGGTLAAIKDEFVESAASAAPGFLNAGVDEKGLEEGRQHIDDFNKYLDKHPNEQMRIAGEKASYLLSSLSFFSRFRKLRPDIDIEDLRKKDKEYFPEPVEVEAPVHKNSLEYVGETHVYRIKGPNGTHKIGESAQGTRVRDGASIRGEQQARALQRETGDAYESQIRKTFPDKRSAREYETNLIERFRRMFGEDTLPGNKTNR